MKCDELQRHSVRGEMFNGEEICGGFAYYDADEVDAAIAELKQKLDKKDMEIFNLKEENSYIKADSTFDRDKHEELLKSKDAEIESLKASHYAEMVDAGMREIQGGKVMKKVLQWLGLFFTIALFIGLCILLDSYINMDVTEVLKCCKEAK